MTRRMLVSRGKMQRVEERDGFKVLLDQAHEGLLPTEGLIHGPDGLVHVIIGDFTYCDNEWALDHYTLRDGWRPIGGDIVPTCFECAGEFLRHG